MRIRNVHIIIDHSSPKIWERKGNEVPKTKINEWGMEKNLIQVQKITPSVERLTIVGKTRRRRRHVCAIFQACYLC